MIRCGNYLQHEILMRTTDFCKKLNKSPDEELEGILKKAFEEALFNREDSLPTCRTRFRFGR